MNTKLNMNSFRTLLCLAILVCGWPSTSLAHKGVMHAKPAPTKPEMSVESGKAKGSVEASFQSINVNYQNVVKPLLLKACGDCHSKFTVMPWYSQIVGISSMIQRDILEAKSHLDISNDFPFDGHGTPEEDLIAIKESISQGEMPPLRYKIMHPTNILSEDDKAKILLWVDNSLRELKR